MFGLQLSYEDREQRKKDCDNKRVVGHGSEYCASLLSLPTPVWMDCHLKEASHYCQMVEWDVELTASELTPFLASVPFRGQ
ncbi:hypothetical protein PIB30_066530 [Stylosanthes scabra]|uniref:Uncharacterized protein n=1 Tax=Stylosanthes scabra TaxID=79078 RepID=A0ABU6SMV0_9FABA|nr:hypothetical protein [Stylosanthes scabra]